MYSLESHDFLADFMIMDFAELCSSSDRRSLGNMSLNTHDPSSRSLSLLAIAI